MVYSIVVVLDIGQNRLSSQKIIANKDELPSAVVSWFGAMQAQDFAAAKWAIALRMGDVTDRAIELAYNRGEILRTHILRPTWHFVTPSDIHWILALTSARIHKFNGYYYRRSGLSEAIFKKSNMIIRKALQGGKYLTRDELNEHLKKQDIPTKSLGLSYTLMQAELDGIICSGPRVGKQFTYMLLDERIVKNKTITGDEAIAEITKRYFQSHGPAQIQDFVWWSGLTVADAKKGIKLVESFLHKKEKDGKMYYFIQSAKNTRKSRGIFLLPGFDEYVIAYRDRSDILDKKYIKYLNQGGGMVNGAIVGGGKMLGVWKRILNKKQVIIKAQLFEKITVSQKDLLEKQAKRYAKFINMTLNFNIKM